MQVEYRGFCITVVDAESRWVKFTEIATGALLPTKLVADPDETLRELAARARRLADMYAGDRIERRLALRGRPSGPLAPGLPAG